MKSQNKKQYKPPRFLFGISSDREFFSENLSALVSSGMPITQALDSISQDVKTRSMKQIIGFVSQAVVSGSSLWKALAKTRVFKDHIVSLIRIGEETGRLSENLKVVALQEQKSRLYTSKIKSAMMYPVFVLGLALVVAVLVAWFILPRLATVFAQLDVELPFITQLLIDLGIFLQEHGSYAVPLFLLFVVAIIFFIFFFKRTKFIGQAFLFVVPGVGRLIQEVEIARFGFLLGTLLEAGIPITSALGSIKDATTFPRYKKFYAFLEESINSGHSIQSSFKKFGKTRKLIPTPIQQLIASAEQSGTLSETLQKIGSLYEAKTEDTTKNLTVMLEPVLLVIVWLGVVGVAFAVILPIYSLIGGFNPNPEIQQQDQDTVEQTPVAENNQEQNIESEVTEDEVVQILRINNDVGEFLNVRDDASTDGEAVGEALPGEVYEYTDEDGGWFEIVLPDDESGWVFGEFVTIIEDDEN